MYVIVNVPNAPSFVIILQKLHRSIFYLDNNLLTNSTRMSFFFFFLFCVSWDSALFSLLFKAFFRASKGSFDLSPLDWLAVIFSSSKQYEWNELCMNNMGMRHDRILCSDSECPAWGILPSASGWIIWPRLKVLWCQIGLKAGILQKK